MIRKGQLFDADAIAELLIATWQICYRTFLPTPFLDEMDLSRQIQRQRRLISSGITYFVNEDAKGNITGFASFGKPRSREMLAGMELYTLYVHPKCQKKGIGKILLQKVIKEKPVGVQVLNVLVMEANPYRTFYEKNDFQFHTKQSMNLDDFLVTNLMLFKQL